VGAIPNVQRNTICFSAALDGQEEHPDKCGETEKHDADEGVCGMFEIHAFTSSGRN
jgi:hypothetical protein